MVLEIRLMRDEDVGDAELCWRDAFADSTEFPLANRSQEDIEQDHQRRRYLIGTDPLGSVVAIDGSELVGLAQSHVREGTFVLSMLAVRRSHQGHGVGSQLLEAVLPLASNCHSAYVFSSSDPRAMQRYLCAGFRLLPAARITPQESFDVDMAGLRVAKGDEEDLDIVDRIDASVRGSRRRSDVSFLLSHGATLLMAEDGSGYALLGDGRLGALGATNERIAKQLLAAAISGAADASTRSVSWIVAEQQWAFALAASVRASIEVHGAMMRRSAKPVPVPYLPNGLFG